MRSLIFLVICIARSKVIRFLSSNNVTAPRYGLDLFSDELAVPPGVSANKRDLKGVVNINPPSGSGSSPLLPAPVALEHTEYIVSLACFLPFV